MSGKMIHLTTKQSLSQNMKEKIDYDNLSEEEFMTAYNSDPFFKERVNVELEKMIRKETGGHLNFSIDECASEDLGEITFKKQSSQNSEQEYQKYQRYLKYISSKK